MRKEGALSMINLWVNLWKRLKKMLIEKADE